MGSGSTARQLFVIESSQHSENTKDKHASIQSRPGTVSAHSSQSPHLPHQGEGAPCLPTALGSSFDKVDAWSTGDISLMHRSDADTNCHLKCWILCTHLAASALSLRWSTSYLCRIEDRQPICIQEAKSASGQAGDRLMGAISSRQDKPASHDPAKLSAANGVPAVRILSSG